MDLCSGELILERGDGSTDAGGDGLIPPQETIAGSSNIGRLEFQWALLEETGSLDSFSPVSSQYVALRPTMASF